MRKLLALLLAALLLAPPLAKAQDATVIIPWASAAPTYTGPGDIVSFTAWYGLRAYSAAVAATGTQKAINITRASDSEVCDVLIATSGSLGLTANCTGADSGITAGDILQRHHLLNQHAVRSDRRRPGPPRIPRRRDRYSHSRHSVRLLGITGSGSATTQLNSAGNFTPSTATQSFQLCFRAEYRSNHGGHHGVRDGDHGKPRRTDG